MAGVSGWRGDDAHGDDGARAAAIAPLTAQLRAIPPVVRRGPKCRRGALETVEHDESPRARKLLAARHDRLDVGRMHHDRKWLRRASGKIRQLVEQARDFVLVRGPARRTQPGADLQHDRVDDRIAPENLEDAIEVALMMPGADRTASVERIAVAAADYVEEGLQLVVRRLRQRGNF